ncbi:MAG: hypothetical protein ABI389_09210 [Rhodanobacter sp.]
MNSFLRPAVALVYSAVLAVSLTLAPPAHASPLTIVSTISGCYDCLSFDTPALIVNNTSGGALANAQLVLKGYQGANDGYSETVSLGNLAAGSTNFVWGSLPGVSNATVPHNLSADDYDDEFIGTSYIIPSSNCGNSGGCVSGGGPQWYALVGNFSLTFTATVSGGAFNGDSVFSVFSPTSNATGGFVSFEGLDTSGYSEQPCCDIHTGAITGDLANIALGTPPTTSVAEPGAFGVFGFGLLMLCWFVGMRRRIA